MDIGVNYPWFDYGWDFGDAPPGWRKDSNPFWATFIDNELQYLHGLGIRVIRWFVFCDGLTYGNGKQAPQQDQDGKWCFNDPPKLSESFQQHFRKLLERFSVANQKLKPPILLLPVLLDYKFCQAGAYYICIPSTPPPGWVSGGRNDIVIKPTTSQKFFECALKRLLDISKDHRSVIFAWDIFNEPEWVTNDWNPHGIKRGLPVSAAQMRQFLQAALERVKSAGFKGTIGFNRIETIHSTKLYADYNQFHHYPGDSRDRKLEPNKFNKPESWIIGEFASSLSGDYWWELSPAQTVLDRLKHAEKMGYPLALPWSVRAKDDHTSWGDAEEGIKKYRGKK